MNTPSRPRSITAARPVRRARPPVVEKGKGQLYTLREPDNVLTDLLKKGRVRLNVFREGKYVHVSDVISKCARKIALIRRLGVKHNATKLLDGHAITFAQGDAIHDFIKRRFVESHPSMVWAQWECRCGHVKTEPMVYTDIKEVHRCRRCRELPSKYHEIPFFEDNFEVVGSPDLLLYLSNIPAFYLAEVKSASVGVWEGLERPLPDHVIQGLFYWWLMRQKGYSLVDQFSILYVKKEYTWKWPYKEFVVKPKEAMRHLDTFFADLRTLAAARDPKNPLPPRVTCATPEAPDAKNCPVCTSCFQLK